jgi:hypothetical protein
MQSSWLRTLVELPRIARRVGTIEQTRRQLGPSGAMALARRLGATCDRRDVAGRAALRRAIVVAEAAVIGLRPNCFRRALLEASLDAGAAAEPLLMGFRHGGGRDSGHAWLASEAQPASGYDAVISV